MDKISKKVNTRMEERILNSYERRDGYTSNRQDDRVFLSKNRRLNKAQGLHTKNFKSLQRQFVL